MLFPRGEWHGEANLQALGGSMRIDDAVFRSMIANWKAAGSPALRLTEHHPDPESRGLDRKIENLAAGWILGGDEGGEMQIRPDGLWAKMKWTADTAELIQADKLRYLSPEWSAAHEDRRTGKISDWWIYGAALTNEPFFNAMPRVAASRITATENTTMDKKLICAMLDLPEDTSDEAVMAALRLKCSASAAPSAGDSSKVTAALDATTKLLASLQKQNETLAASVAALAAKDEAASVTSLEDALVAARKLSPAQRETKIVATFVKAVGLEATRKHFEAMPDVVTAGELGHSSPGALPAEFSNLTPKAAAEKVIALVDELETKEKLDTSKATARVAAAHPAMYRLAAQYQRQLDNVRE